MTLLDDILAASSKKLAERMLRTPLADVKRRAADCPRADITFRAALEASPFSIIAEVKARSPSSGAMDAKNVRTALETYDATPSVSAISILTDEENFGGSLDRLLEARQRTKKPLLRKDFIVDEYQVWEARAHGADAVLLMADLYLDDPERLARLFDVATGLGMDALFELGMKTVAAPSEIIPKSAAIWGINSRRFHTTKFQARATVGRLFGRELSIDSNAHAELRSRIPAGKLAIAESGISSTSDLKRIFDRNHRVDRNYCAALIGTAFLKKGADVVSVVRAFDEEVRQMSVAERSEGFANGTRARTA